MKIRLLDRLVCPLDRTPLELVAWERIERPLDSAACARAERVGIAPASLASEVLEGALVNRQRNVVYPIVRGVPRMLTFATRISEEFWAKQGGRLQASFPGIDIPRESGQPGEADVLRTFSSEWVNFDWDGKAYWGLTPEGWFRAMRFALNLEHLIAGREVLEIGTGVGGFADYVARVEGAELFGVDLGYAIDVAFKHFGDNPFLHTIQASVFAPPFRPETFDFAYSFGVLHHTFSTERAFASIARLPKVGGRLYVWVYSPYDEERTFVRRRLMNLENVIRPVMWRLPEWAQSVALSPFVPLYMAHQWYQSRQGNRETIRYGVREAMHAARDRFTPPFVGRHTEEEVKEWFHAANYARLEGNSERARPDYVPLPFMTCAGVSGEREIAGGQR